MYKLKQNRIIYTIVISILIISLPVKAQLNINHWLNSGRDKLIESDNMGAMEYFNTLIKFIPDLDEAYYLRAVSKYNLGDYRGALEDLNKAIEIKPYFSYYYLYRGEIKNKLYDLYGARDDFEKSIELKANNPDTYVGRGVNSLLLKKYDDAIQDFSNAISLDRSNSYAYLYRALAKQSLKKNDSAKSDFDKAIELNPLVSDFYVRRGRNFIEMNDTTAALTDFNYAISIDSTNSFAFFNRAMVFYEKGDSLSALNDFNTVIKLDPENALCYFNRAEIKSKMGDYRGALEDYNRVIQINPNNIYTYFNRGIVYFILRNWKKAIEDYTHAIELNSEFVAAYYNRSIAKRQIGDILGAKKDFEMAMKINNEKNSNREATLDSSQLAKIIDFKADFEKGNVTIYQTFEAGVPAFSNFQFTYLPSDSINSFKLLQSELILDFSKNMPDNNALLISYRELSLSPDTIEKLIARYDSIPLTIETRQLILARATLKAMRQNYSQAIDDCDLIIKKFPDYIWAYFMRGAIQFKLINLIHTIKSQNLQYYSIGNNQAYPDKKSSSNSPDDYNEVIEDYNKCIQLNPNFPYAYFNLANVEIEKGNFDKAIEQFTNAIKLNPKFAEAYFNRGLTYIYIKNNSDGCMDLSKAGELGVANAYPIIRKYCNN
jgi:tetratricopeptide (TPR) repeat protein